VADLRPASPWQTGPHEVIPAAVVYQDLDVTIEILPIPEKKMEITHIPPAAFTMLITTVSSRSGFDASQNLRIRDLTFFSRS
jgi:hypothetical protein